MNALIAYDKFKESHDESARDILRIEAKIRTNSYLEKLMGKTNPTLGDLTVRWANEILQDNLEKLQLTKPIICNRDPAAEMLIDKYGWNEGSQLFGYWILRQSITREQMLAKGANLRTLQQWEKDVKDAGLPANMTNSVVALPPLKIEC